MLESVSEEVLTKKQNWQPVKQKLEIMALLIQLAVINSRLWASPDASLIAGLKAAM